MLSRRDLLFGAAALGATACLRRTATARSVTQVVTARPGRDGAGVNLRRALGGPALPMVDPFLMLDEIHSDDPADYAAGFPDHPHRGFETVSIVPRGSFVHADSVGNRGVIADGGVQWMTAGRGIVHSERPRATTGTEVWGLQLWVNLPAARKWDPPRYQDLAASVIPTAPGGDAQVRVVAGRVGATRGPVDGLATAPTLLDVTAAAGAGLHLPVAGGDAALLYVLAGAIAVGPAATAVASGQLAVLGPGDTVALTARADARLLVIAGAPLGEPVARRGPFVMTTAAELDQAFADYRAGRLAG